MKHWLNWKIDLAITLIVLVVFELIDQSIVALEDAPFYHDWLVTAKWLLAGGFTLHALVDWFIRRR